jgi:hypothetical protein
LFSKQFFNGHPGSEICEDVFLKPTQIISGSGKVVWTYAADRQQNKKEKKETNPSFLDLSHEVTLSGFEPKSSEPESEILSIEL